MPGKADRRSFERQPARREIGRKVIIVCEGSETEKGYFNAIRASLRLTTVQVAVYHPGATNPRRIVEAAKQKQQEQIDSGGWDEAVKGDCVWAVYDDTGLRGMRRDRCSIPIRSENELKLPSSGRANWQNKPGITTRSCTRLFAPKGSPSL